MKKYKKGEIKKILRLQRKIMQRLGQDAIERIRLDAAGGLFQGSSAKLGPTGTKYNKQYARYKRNGMRRFTDNKKLKKNKTSRYGATNTETRVVNMNLTGKTLRGMKAAGTTTSALIKYPPESHDLILGNQARGYDIYNFSEKNLDYIKDRFDEVLITPRLNEYINQNTKL
tara:strand:- start:1556 stop:2068 length:513 start_codon:yes stop_codon:yes gene_type:complete